MKKKLKIEVPHVIRREDEVYVGLKFGLTHVHVRRCKLSGKWQKAILSWSGGNGAETVPETQVFSDMITWALTIAANMNSARNPFTLSTDRLVYAFRPTSAS